MSEKLYRQKIITENVSACGFTPTDKGSIIVCNSIIEISSYNVLVRHAKACAKQKLDSLSHIVTIIPYMC